MAKRKQNQASEFSLSRPDILKIIQAASEISKETPLRNRTIVGLLYWCGMRREEVATLDMRDIDYDQRALTITSGKGDKQRTIPIRPELLDDLRILLQGRKIPRDKIEDGKRVHTAAPVFASARIKKGETKSIDVSVINRIVKDAAEHAQVKNPNPSRRNVGPHLFRHSFGRHWLDSGRDLRALSAILGHESIATTADIYGTPSQERIHSEYDAFSDVAAVSG